MVRSKNVNMSWKYLGVIWVIFPLTYLDEVDRTYAAIIELQSLGYLPKEPAPSYCKNQGYVINCPVSDYE